MPQPSGAPLFAWTTPVRVWRRCEEFRAAQRDFPAIRSADCRTRAISRVFSGMFAALSADIGFTVANIGLARRFRLPALLWRLAALVFLLLMAAAAHILPYALIDMTARDSRPQGDVR